MKNNTLNISLVALSVTIFTPYSTVWGSDSITENSNTLSGATSHTQTRRYLMRENGVEPPFSFPSTGLSVPESTHTWATDDWVTITIPASQKMEQIKSIVFEDTFGLISEEYTQTVNVFLNGNLVNSYHYSLNSPHHTIEVPFLANVVGDEELKFEMKNACLPRIIDPGNLDPRKLSIGFRTCVITHVSKTPTANYNMGIDDPHTPWTFGESFSGGEISHRWTDAKIANLKVNRVTQNGKIKQIQFDTSALVSHLHSQKLVVWVNGVKNGEYSYSTEAPSQLVTVDFSSNPSEIADIKFDIPTACQPCDIISSILDPRMLAISFSAAKVTYTSDLAPLPPLESHQLNDQPILTEEVHPVGEFGASELNRQLGDLNSFLNEHTGFLTENPQYLKSIGNLLQLNESTTASTDQENVTLSAPSITDQADPMTKKPEVGSSVLSSVSRGLNQIRGWYSKQRDSGTTTSNTTENGENSDSGEGKPLNRSYLQTISESFSEMPSLSSVTSMLPSVPVITPYLIERWAAQAKAEELKRIIAEMQQKSLEHNENTNRMEGIANYWNGKTAQEIKENLMPIVTKRRDSYLALIQWALDICAKLPDDLPLKQESVIQFAEIKEKLSKEADAVISLIDNFVSKAQARSRIEEAKERIVKAEEQIAKAAKGTASFIQAQIAKAEAQIIQSEAEIELTKVLEAEEEIKVADAKKEFEWATTKKLGEAKAAEEKAAETTAAKVKAEEMYNAAEAKVIEVEDALKLAKDTKQETVSVETELSQAKAALEVAKSTLKLVEKEAVAANDFAKSSTNFARKKISDIEDVLEDAIKMKNDATAKIANAELTKALSTAEREAAYAQWTHLTQEVRDAWIVDTSNEIQAVKDPTTKSSDPKSNRKIRYAVNEQIFNLWGNYIYDPLDKKITQIKEVMPDISNWKLPFNPKDIDLEADRAEKELWHNTVKPWWTNAQIERDERLIESDLSMFKKNKELEVEIAELRWNFLIKSKDQNPGKASAQFEEIKREIGANLDKTYNFYLAELKSKQEQVGQALAPVPMLFADPEKSEVRAFQRKMIKNIQKDIKVLGRRHASQQILLKELALEPGDDMINASVLIRLFKDAMVFHKLFKSTACFNDPWFTPNIENLKNRGEESRDLKHKYKPQR